MPSIRPAMTNVLPPDVVKGLAPNARRVYDYLMTGRKITSLIAVANLNVGSLSSRVSELRRKGLDVTFSWKKDGWGNRFKAYFVKDLQKDG